MREVTLSKALNVKNRTAGKVAKLKRLFAQNNSQLVGANNKFVAADLKAQYEAESAKLVAVKTAIAVANAKNGVAEKVFQMSEIKDKIQTIQGLNTRDGKEEKEVYKTGNYATVEVEYKALIDEAKKEELVEELTDQLEKIQDEINAINHSHKVEIPD